MIREDQELLVEGETVTHGTDEYSNAASHGKR